MTKISQLTDLGGNLAAGDEFVVRDVSDGTTPNKKVTASGFADYIINQGTGSGFSQIAAGAGPAARVQTTASGSDGTIAFQTNTLERARIDSSGRLLVGTSTSTSIGGVGATVQIRGALFKEHGLSITRSAADAANSEPFLYLANEFNPIGNGAGLGTIGFAGHDGTDVNSIGAWIRAQVDGTTGADDMPGRLVFSTTADGASSPTERMRIDSSGRVGIGTTSPLRPLTVVGSGYTGIINVSDTSGGTAWGMLSLGAHSTTANDVGVWRGDANQLTGGNFLNLGCRNGIVFAVSSADLGLQSERARIDSSGYLRMAASTGGIQFNGDTAATNALDDYEEGTWTPVVKGTSTTGTVSYGDRVGKYTKIGRVVHFELYINWSSGTGTGNLFIDGLPFTADSTNSSYPAASYAFPLNLALSANHTLSLFVSGTGIYFYQDLVGGGSGSSVPYDAACGDLTITGTYFV